MGVECKPAAAVVVEVVAAVVASRVNWLVYLASVPALC